MNAHDRKFTLRPLQVVLIAVLVAFGCGANRNSAEAALAAAETQYARIAEDVKNLAPDQDADLDAALTSVHETVAKGEFAAAVKLAKETSARIKLLRDALPELRAKLEGDWKQLSTTVPGALTALDRKLANSGRPPAGMPERAKYDASKEALGRLRLQWDEARSLVVSGKMAQAVASGNQVQDELVRAITELQEGS